MKNITVLLLTTLLTAVCYDVLVEHSLQPLTGEKLQQETAKGNEARLGICSQGFWVAGPVEIFEIRFFNVNALRYAKLNLSKIYEVNEKKSFTMMNT